jgi:protease-4
MGNVAASGGYWVATPADFILAEPSTITGSIGVFGILPSFQGSLEKLGLGADGVKTTPLSGEPDLLRGPSPEANQLLQASVDSIYRRFLSLVGRSRGKSPAEIDRVAQGRVWDGGTARQLGLIDGFGGMEEAVAKAAELAKLGDERGVRYLERPPTLRETLLEAVAGEEVDDGAGEDAFSLLAGAPQQAFAAALADLRAILSGPAIQARCLECGPVAPAALTPADRGLLGLLGRLL